jgi:23S rRNA (cytidine1920-2'-O)/16S rRNA (cytidine1409-2'-O)-methyltransferase
MYRLDFFLVEKNIIESRNKAQTLIKNNNISVNGSIINKPSFMVNDNDDIKVIDNLKYVSRAGEKLKFAIDKYKINFINKNVLDLGASTGGFVDCCLQEKSKKVFAVDVGIHQLHKKLLNNSKVINLEKTNIKELNNEIINEKIDIILSDLSFTSSTIVFDSIKNIEKSDDHILIILIKPQFELNEKIIKKNKGHIKDQKYHKLAIDKICSYAKQNNYSLLQIDESPLLGAKNNNKEFIAIFKHE